MNIKTGLWGFSAVAALAMMASCSGSSTSDHQTTGGSSSSTAGTSSAGTSTAGTTTSGAGTSSSNGGTSSSAGTTSGGGTRNVGGALNVGGAFNFGGNFNLGGAGFDPADFMCDAGTKTGAACATGAQPCASGTSVCLCQNMKWGCTDLAGIGEGGAGPGGIFGNLDCPGTEPKTGDACGSSFGFCPYGQNMGCACFGGTWTCQ